MRSRIIWFVAGSAGGVYATVKARRAAYRLSMPGLVDQAAALGLGWRAFSAEVNEGMEAREHDIARRLSGDLPPLHDHSTLSLDEAHTDKDHH